MRPQAFNGRARLSGQAPFRALLRSRRTARGERFLVHVTANGHGFARLGIVVGKRVAPRAVDRSYLKRLVRETFRQTQREWVGYDLLVRPRRILTRGEGSAAMDELRSLLASALR